MENLKCRLCSIHCSGPDQYKQHIEGGKHKKKEHLRAGILQCVTPPSNTRDSMMPPSISILDQHMLMPEIGELSDTRRSPFVSSMSANENDCDSSAVTSHDQQHFSGSLRAPEPVHNDPNFIPDNFFCQICNMPCTGLFPYQQHLKGKNHNKRSKQLNLSSIANSSRNASSNACGSALSTGTDFMDTGHQQSNAIHSSSDHVEPTSTLETPDDEGSLECGELGERPIVIRPDTVEKPKPNHIQKQTPIKNTPSLMNYNCDVCQIVCTGPDQYNQHILGKQHKKKQPLQSPAAVNAPEIPTPSLYKYFFPQSSVSQNPILKSENEGTLSSTATNEVAQMSKKYNTGNGNFCQVSGNQVAGETITATSISDYRNMNPNDFNCPVCDVLCTGLEPYTQHINGKLHQKKARCNIAYPDSSVGDLKNDANAILLSNFKPDKDDLLQLGISVIEPDEEVTLDNF